MNSFNTHEDTMAILKKYAHSRVRIETFNQSKYPRILKDSLTPLPKSTTNTNLQEWYVYFKITHIFSSQIIHRYPPGHGDVFQSLYDSGLLDQLLNEGKEYIFISNIDNLAATVNFGNYLQIHFHIYLN